MGALGCSESAHCVPDVFVPGLPVPDAVAMPVGIGRRGRDHDAEVALLATPAVLELLDEYGGTRAHVRSRLLLVPLEPVEIVLDAIELVGIRVLRSGRSCQEQHRCGGYANDQIPHGFHPSMVV